MSQRIEELVAQARQFPPEQQKAFLVGACGGDAELLKAVEARLLDEGKAAEESADRTSESPKRFASDEAATIPPTVRSEGVGHSIGRYKLLQEIGEGGFGSVFMAEQREPVKRRVALKIIKLGMDTRQVIARFEAERQALAMMDHPNIARVLDAGATDAGRPYFVMELVKGVPITEYCDRNSLTVRERLELMIPVCHAIQHAHQKGIIHRDIKPSNVLVTLHDGKPVPKVIDFGIAKATNTDLTDKTVFTEFRQFIGTPLYMSPEQAEMSGLDIDTRSDVYSLGVLLYELVTGSTPCDRETIRGKNFAEIQIMIVDHEPVSPSTRLSSSTGNLEEIAKRRKVEPSRLGALIRGELDWITLKALEKDRTRRYSSARELADDIGRYLNNEPIAAAPPSRWYQWRKAIRRHRALFATGALIAAALMIAAIGATWGMLRAVSAANREAQQRVLAEQNAQEAAAAKEQAEQEAQRALAAERHAAQRANELKRMADFQASTMQNLNVGEMGARMRESIIAEVESTGRNLQSSSELKRAQALQVVELLEQINFTNAAVQGLEKNILGPAVEQIETQFSEQPLMKAQLLQNVGEARSMLGLGEPAVDLFRRVYELRREALGDADPETIAALGMWGVELFTKYGYQGKNETLQKAVKEAQTHLGNEHPLTCVLEYTIRGNMDPIFQEGQPEVIAWWARLTPGLTLEDASIVADVIPKLMQRLAATGVMEESGGSRRPDPEVAAQALAIFEEFLASLKNQMADTHPLMMQFRFVAGRNAMSLGLPERAEPLIRDALASQRHSLGDQHPSTQMSMLLLVEILDQRNQRIEAGQLADRLLVSMRENFGENHPALATPLQAIMRQRIDLKKWSEAKNIAEQIITIVRPSQSNQPEQWASALVSLSTEFLEEEIDELEEAREIYRLTDTWMQECYELRQQHLPEDWLTANAQNLLGFAQLKRVRSDDLLTEEEQAELLNKAETCLLAGFQGLSEASLAGIEDVLTERRYQAAGRLVQFYEFLHSRSQSTEHAEKAEQWRQRRDTSRQN